jgi:hypothetical protein
MFRKTLVGSDRFDVLLAYNHRDASIVDRLASHLTRRRLRVWLDRRQIQPSMHWLESLWAAIHSCRAAVILLGPHGLSFWLRREIGALLDRASIEPFAVIPVLLPGWPRCARPPGFLSQIDPVDLRRGLRRVDLDRLTRSLRTPPAPPRLLRGAA